MAARDDVLATFAALGLNPPSGDRLNRIVGEIDAGTRNILDVRNDLIDFMASQQGVTPEEIVAGLINDRFEELGLDPPDAERLARLVDETYGGSGAGDIDEGRTFQDIEDRLREATGQTPTTTVGDTTIPSGAELVRVRNPTGSDAPETYYLVYTWRGVEFSYEIGDAERLEEQFGGVEGFDSVSTVSQAGFDERGTVEAGLADQLYGSEESFGAVLDREVRALGMEDLPGWLADDADALALVAQATAQGWSSGRLWTELSETEGFVDRFGAIIDQYTEGGTTIAAAVEQIVADEQSMRAAIRRFRPEGFEVTNEYLHGVMGQGWTATSAAAVLEVADDLRRNPDGLALSNEILAAAGLDTLDEVGFMNAMQGHGAPEVIEALNTAQAGRALTEAGLEDLDVDLLMEVVDTSDRLTSADSYRDLAQQLAFNTMRFGQELDRESFGLTDDDLVAAAFGRESPSGKSSGEVLNLLARFERDRRAQSEGAGGFTGFQDQQGRLRVAGISGL